MITMISTEKLKRMVERQVNLLLSDEVKRRAIAMEYLLTLNTSKLNKFLKAVELRKESDKLLDKLDEQEPDIDKAGQDLQYEMDIDTKK